MIGIRRFSSGIFGLVFILALFGCISEVDVSEPDELRLAAWNIRIMSDKSRTDTELKQIAKTIADYDFIAIVELRDEMVLQRTQKSSRRWGKCMITSSALRSGAVSKSGMRSSTRKTLSVLSGMGNSILMRRMAMMISVEIRTGDIPCRRV